MEGGLTLGFRSLDSDLASVKDQSVCASNRSVCIFDSLEQKSVGCNAVVLFCVTYLKLDEGEWVLVPISADLDMVSAVDVESLMADKLEMLFRALGGQTDRLRLAETHWDLEFCRLT